MTTANTMRTICVCVILYVTVVQSLPQIDSVRKYFSNEPQVKIINGEVCKPHSMPFIVRINIETIYGPSYCAGSLISPNFVLTVAHCLEWTKKAELVLGAHNITENEPTQVRQLVNNESFIIHPGYTTEKFSDDIGLIKLHEPIIENDYIKIAKLATGTNTFAGSVGRVAGWGITDNEQTVGSPVLRYVDGAILTNKACREADDFWYGKYIEATHICLSGVSDRGHIDSCHGDSGGPLSVDGVLVGLVSFGNPTCGSGAPSAFTRVSSYTDWITNNTDVVLNKE